MHGQDFSYFYGSRMEENGGTDSYGKYLASVYPNGNEFDSKNNTNGVRAIIKLKYTIKLRKTTDSLGNIVWSIIDE